MNEATPIIIADDHPIVRQGLRQTIEAAGEFRVLAEASDGQEALALIAQLHPAIAVLDIDMPLLDGFGVARVLRERELASKVVFLTVHREEMYLQQALQVGAHGYVLKDSAITDIVASLHAARDGAQYLSPLMETYLTEARRAAPRPRLPGCSNSPRPNDKSCASLLNTNPRAKLLSHFLSARTPSKPIAKTSIANSPCAAATRSSNSRWCISLSYSVASRRSVKYPVLGIDTPPAIA